MQYLAVALGGALGSMARFAVVQYAGFIFPKTFPWGTLVVNALGAFLIGLLFVVIVEKSQWTEAARMLLIVGFLGAFTTFSTFSLENLQLLEQGAWIKAGANIIAHVGSGLVLVWLGSKVARHFL